MIADSLREVLNDFFESDPVFSVIVITALSGSKGVELFEAYVDSNQKKKAPNVVMSDLSMPNGIDGDEMVKRIRELGFDPLVFFYDGHDRCPPKCEFDCRFKKTIDPIKEILAEIRKIILKKFQPIVVL